MAEPMNLDLTSLFPTTYTLESPLGVVTVQDVSVGEYGDAQKSGTFDELIRSQMIVSLTRPNEDVPIPVVDLPERELDEVVVIVKADQEAKWKEVTAKMKESLEGLIGSIAPKMTSPFASLYSNINQQAQAHLDRLMPPLVNLPTLSHSRATQHERDRELQGLKSQIAAVEMLENIYDKMVETAQQNQNQYQENYSLQIKILGAAVGTLFITVIGLLVALLVQLYR